ncbi:MAG: hypothetical protein AAGG79_05635 [Pseudomonadota bacterium]
MGLVSRWIAATPRASAVLLLSLSLAGCALFPSPGSSIKAPPELDLTEVEPKSLLLDPDRIPTPTFKADALAQQNAEDAPDLQQLAEEPSIPVRRGLPEAYFPDSNLALQQDLSSDDPTRVRGARDLIEADPEAFPPYLYAALSDALFRKGEKDAASFWFYASQLRIRYDANRCNLSSAPEEHARILAEIYGAPITKALFEEPERAAATLGDVLLFDASVGNNYDPRWIYYLPVEGEGAASGAAPATKLPPSEATCQPKDRWPLIKDATRMAYERDMMELLPPIPPGRRTASLYFLP